MVEGVMGQLQEGGSGEEEEQEDICDQIEDESEPECDTAINNQYTGTATHNLNTMTIHFVVITV